jgi:hypothetical protein
MCEVTETLSITCVLQYEVHLLTSGFSFVQDITSLFVRNSDSFAIAVFVHTLLGSLSGFKDFSFIFRNKPTSAAEPQIVGEKWIAAAVTRSRTTIFIFY